MEPGEFRELLRKEPADQIVDEYILSEESGNFLSQEAITSLETKMRVAFQVSEEHTVSAIVVGSAKLGFALLEKKNRDGTFKPAFRAYRPGVSDVDVALISPVIYGKVWQDLARYGAEQDRFPWINNMAPHMFHGWIRPDKFPLIGPQRCDDWRRTFEDVSRSQHFRYKKLRCGLYHSKYFLKLYQRRGILAAQQAEYAK